MNPPEHYAGRAAESAVRAKANRNRRLAHKLVRVHHTHTKGPWYVLPDPLLKDLHPLHEARFITTSTDVELRRTAQKDANWRFANDTDVIIATMPDSINQKANAALIAAAPELLAALERVTKRLTYHTASIESCDLEASDELALEQARAALSAARAAATPGGGQ